MAIRTRYLSDEQRDAWKPITESVHKAGGRIHVQLWHMGRVVHPSLNNGAIPISSSDIKAPGQAHTYDGKQDYVQPRSLPLDEIPALLNDYRRAARNAIDAGFDGIQIHAANGYLLDQFLRDSDNKRTDQYGGSIENRIRLLLEVVKTISEEIGADRVGVRLSPNGASQGTNDSDPVALFTAAAKGLSDAGIAYLEMREPDRNGTFGKADRDPIAPEIRKVFKGPIILNSDYDPERAQRSLDEGNCDAVAFGRPFIANPDLVYRVVHKLPLNKDNMATWYSQGPEGYIDYPILAKE